MELASNKPELRLDLGCGQNPREGFEGVDLYAPEVKHRVDLMKFPWPFATNSVEEIHCSHFVEHLPAREVQASDIATNALGDVTLESYLNKDFLFAFFDECYRILKPGGKITIIVPSAMSVRGFQDPTHRRFIMRETFLYLSKEWRTINKLDHYNVVSDYGINVSHTFSSEISLRHPEFQAHAFQHFWNTTFDFHALLFSKKEK